MTHAVCVQHGERKTKYIYASEAHANDGNECLYFSVPVGFKRNINGVKRNVSEIRDQRLCRRHNIVDKHLKIRHAWLFVSVWLRPKRVETFI